MIYLGAFAGLTFLRFQASRRLYVPLLVALFLFAAFRFEVGCDWSGYLNEYYIYPHFTWPELTARREPLWVISFIAQGWLGLPYPWINVFSSLIFFLGVHTMARREPNAVAFLVLLFPILIINMPMSGIRQGVAVGIMCMAYMAFVDRALVRFVALTVIAAGFHSSAAVFLLLAPLVHGEYSWKRLVFAAVLSVPGGYALLSGDDASLAVSRYVGTDVDAAGAIFRGGFLVATAAFFLLMLRRSWAATFPNEYKLAVIGSFMMAALVVVVPVSSVIGDRIGYYLIPIQTMILARLPYLQLRWERQLMILSPYLALFLIFAIWTSLSNHFNACYVPYQSWLFGFPETATYIW